MKQLPKILFISCALLGLSACERKHAAHGIVEKEAADFEQIINWRVPDSAAVINLRIPLGYVQLPPEWLSRDVSREELNDLLNRNVDGDRFSYEALLPGMRARTTGQPGSEAEILTAIIDSNYSDRLPAGSDPLQRIFDFHQASLELAPKKNCEWADVHYEGSRLASNKDVVCGTRPASTAVAGKGAFGLDELENSPDFREYEARYGRAGRLNQVFYRRGTDGHYAVVIQCAPAVAATAKDAGKDVVPLCSQTYYSPWLDARVRLTYARRWLGDWQSLQTQSEKLLASFVRK